MGSLLRQMQRQRQKQEQNRAAQIQQHNEMNRLIANAMAEQLMLLGHNPSEVDYEKEIKESSISHDGRRVTHYHYKNVLLVEVIRESNDAWKHGFDFKIRVPKRDTDGAIILDSEGKISVN